MISGKNYTSRILTILFCCAFNFLSAQGLQRYPVRIYSPNTGLSQSSVYHILKDRTGYMWIGTGDGLNRISPASVQVFKRDFRNGKGLFSNPIRGLIEDPLGNIWIGTDKGLNLYDQEKEEVMRQLQNNALPTGAVVPIGIYKGRLVAMKQYEKLFCVDILTGKIIESYPLKAPFYSDNRYYRIVGDYIWTATLDARVLKLNLDNGISNYILPPVSQGFNIINQIGPTFNNQLYISADSSLYSLDTETEKWTKIAQLDGQILAFGFVNNNQIWVSVRDKGLCRLDLSGAIIEPFVSELSTDVSGNIDLRTISTISQTDDGMVWLGVEGTGALSILPISNFQWISKDDPYVPGLTNSFCRGITVLNSNEFLIGTYLSGIFQFNLTENKVTPLKYPKEVGENITSILLWQADTLFVSTETGVWMLTDAENFSFRKSKRIFNSNINLLTRFGDRLILSVENGLYGFYPHTVSDVALIHSGNFRYAYAAQNKLWTAEWGGIDVFDEHFNKIAFGGRNIVEYEIKSLYISEKTGGWVSTRNGLLNFDLKTFRIIRQFTTSEGLPDNNVYGVVSDGDLLWGSTNHGLFSIDTHTGKIRAFNKSDGLYTNEFNSNCFANLPDDRLIFGGVNGLTIFTPENISDNVTDPKIILKTVWLNDKLIDQSYLGKPLNSTERNFVFEWDILEWTQPDKIHLECKLVGLDTGWVTLGAENRIRYTSLAAGDFKLYTRASFADGLFGTENLSAKFHVALPFYRTWWFISAAILAIALLFGTLIYRKAVAKYQKKLAILERQKEMDNLRKRISRDIHDDVGSDLSKMRMLLQKEKRQGQRIPPHLLKLKELSEKALSGLSEVVWTVNSDYDNLPQMAAWFRSFAYDFFESEDIRVNFECAEKLPEYIIEPDTRRNILMIYKEGLNNVLKHAAASEIDIRFNCSNNGEFSLEWTDNGKGFSNDKRNCGNGLQNMQRRAETSGLEYSIISTPSKGTHISIKGNLA